MFKFVELLAKVIAFVLKRVFKTAGETWPGEIALRIYPNLPKHLSKYFKKIIFVVGTNGKTSTSKLLKEVLIEAGYEVISNPSGANLLNGIVSNILLQKKLFKDKNYVGVFEIDEYYLPQAIEQFAPSVIIILNLLRDQLDRYGEVANVLDKWRKSLKKHQDIQIIANAYDPGIYALGRDLKTVQFFAVPEAYLRQDTFVFGDYVYCFNCSYKFNYSKKYVAHIGKWNCPNCGLSPNNYFVFSEKIINKLKDIPDYLVINSQAVYLLCRKLAIDTEILFKHLKTWQPAYGRGEVVKKNKRTFIFYLGKNPAGWTVALENLLEKHKQSAIFLFGLNNKIPDGRDVSWIWDIYISKTSCRKLNKRKIVVYGDRSYDLAERLKLEGVVVDKVVPDSNKLKKEIDNYQQGVFIILANYSAMLEARRLIVGRAIL